MHQDAPTVTDEIADAAQDAGYAEPPSAEADELDDIEYHA